LRNFVFTWLTLRALSLHNSWLWAQQDSLMDMAASLRAKARRWANDGNTATAAPAATVSGSGDYDDDDKDDAPAARSSTAAAATAAAGGAAQQPLSTGTKLLEFSQHMKRTGLLSTEEAAGVRALVQEGSLVLNSAYAVALADKVRCAAQTQRVYMCFCIVSLQL
jgi:hypothetical protein